LGSNPPQVGYTSPCGGGEEEGSSPSPVEDETQMGRTGGDGVSPTTPSPLSPRVLIEPQLESGGGFLLPRKYKKGGREEMQRRIVKEIRNYTPHPLELYDGNEKLLTIEPTGYVVRAKEEKTKVGELLFGNILIPVYRMDYGATTLVNEKTKEELPLPQVQEGVVLVVSSLAAQSLRKYTNRDDFLVPGDPVRDEKGRIIGMRGLCII